MKKRITAKIFTVAFVVIFAFALLGMRPENSSYAVSWIATFTSNITVGSDNAVPCTFVITDAGTAQIGQGITAIPTSASGDIVIPDTVTYEGKSYVVTALYDRCFYDCDNLTGTGLETNDTVTSLGEDCFAWCDGLKSTGLGTNSSVSTLGMGCFAGCTALTDTGLGTNHTIDTISQGCFEICTSLTNTGLETNDTVKYVGNAAFCACSSLTSTGLKTNNTVVSVDGSAFESCPKLTSTGLETNSSVKSLAAVGFGVDSSIVHVAVGSGVTSVGNRCFGWYDTLEDVCFYGDAISSMPKTWTDSPVPVYYLSENDGWLNVTVPNAASITPLSRVKIVGGSTDSTPTNYWSLSTGNGAGSATEGRFAEGDKITLSLSAGGNSNFVKWTTDDPTGTFDNAASPTAIYTVGKSAGKETTTITAVYEELYTASFDLNGGGSPQPDPQVLAEGSNLTAVEDPTWENYTFGGWYKDKECTEAWDFANDTMPANDITLYAKWTLVNDADNPGETDQPVFEAPYDEESGSQTGDSSTPDTGDPESGITLLLMLLGMSASALTGMVVLQRKRKSME